VKEDLLQPVGRQVFDDEARGLGPRGVGVLRRDRAQQPRLLRDRLDDARVLVPDVREHELGGEVEVAPPAPSQSQLPLAAATTIGFSAACADQEWNTCARSSPCARRPASGSITVGGSGRVMPEA